MTDVNFNTVAKALLENQWVFAKTMPQAPHWYTLRKNWQANIAFEDAVQFIRDYGYREKYGRSWYVRLDINEMKYWSMGAPLPETILINRAVREIEEAYDTVADQYDALWADPAALKENEAAAQALNYQGGSILDVGCGTGLLLDLIKPDAYFGLDPSRGMLKRLNAAHPDAETVCARFERFYTERKFDLVVSLFGSPSYIPPAAWSRLPELLNPGGRFFLMFFSPGYDPVTHQYIPDAPSFYPYETLPPGKVSQLGNFTIVESL